MRQYLARMPLRRFSSATVLAVLVIVAGLLVTLAPSALLVGLAGLAALGIVLLFARPYWGVVALIVAATMNGLTYYLAIGQTRVQIRPDQLVLVALLVVLMLGYIQGRSHIYRSELDVPILGLVAANLVSSVLYSSQKSASVQSVVLMSVYAAMYFVTFSILVAQPPGRLYQIVRLFVGVGIIQAVVGILAIVLFALGITTRAVQFGQTVNSVSLAGTFVEANLLAIYLVVIGVFVLTYLVRGTLAQRRLILLLGCLGIILLALALTLTRSAWIAMGASICVILLSAGQRRSGRFLIPRRVLIILGVLLGILAVVLLVSALSLGALSQQSNLLGQRVTGMLSLSDSSIVGRLSIYKLAFVRWLQQPLLGYGTFSGQEVGERWLYSSILQTLHDTGIIGLFFFLWLQVKVIWLSWQESHRTLSPFYRSTLFAMALSNTVILFTSQTSSIYWIGLPWVFMGLSMALVHASRIERVAELAL